MADEKEKIDSDDIYVDHDIEKDINLGDTLSTDKDMTVVEGIDEALGGTNDDEMIEGGEATEPEVQPEPEPEGVIERTPEKYAEEEHGAPPEPEPSQVFTVKVDGEESLVSQDQLVAGYQKAASSDNRFRAAAEMEERSKGILKEFLNPDDAIGSLTKLYAEHYQGDFGAARDMVDQIVGSRVEELMELESMTDEEKRIRELTEENERMQASLQQQTSQRDQDEEVHRITQGNTAAVSLLDEAIKKFDIEIGSPEDTEASEMLAQYVRQNQAVTPELVDQVVSEVVSRRSQLLHNAVDGMSAEELLKTNPQLAADLQGKRIEQIKESRATNQAEQPTGSPAKRRRESNELDSSSNDFFNQTDW